MHPIVFQVGNLVVYSHGLLAAVGILIGSFFIGWLAKRHGLKLREYWDMILYSILAGLVGARLGYVILYYHEFSRFREIFYIWQGGLVSYTGLIFGFGMAAWWLYLKKQKIAPWLDVGILGVLLGWGIARIGCFLAGDLIGKVTESRLGIIFPTIDFLPRFPVALFEAVGVFLLFGILIYLFQKKTTFPGLIFILGVAGYALIRFGVDFWRIYSFGPQPALNLSQIFSLIVLVISIIILIYLKRKVGNGSKIYPRKKS